MFGYDGLDRLVSTAQYKDYTLENKFGEDITYDRNGNITSLGRRNGSSSTETEYFTYDGNKRTDMVYDSNGNAYPDQPEEEFPVYVKYNILNLPAFMTAEEDLGETLYLADGTKLAMLDGTSSGIKYVGSFRYDASEPDFIDVAVAGGLAVPTVNGWAVRYFTTDHLGSIRLVTDASGTVFSQNDYLPYGKKCWNTGLANQYKSDYLYGGKESTEIFGIEGYDSVARWQTTSGVFSSPDPLMEKYYPISPYAYCAGNPVNNIDPSGADNWDKVAGALIGVFTDIAPGTGFIRDLYRPSSSSDYNNALRKADVLSATVGCSMLTGGGTIAAVGASTTVSGAMAMATVVAAPEGAAVATGGAAVSTVGEVVASTGVMMMANAAINAGKGYKRGHQDIESASNTSKSNNKELGQSEVPIPEGYRKTRFQSHGKSVYTNGKYFISRDADSHNGGIWKKAKSIKELQSRKTRMGTYDINLNRIGD